MLEAKKILEQKIQEGYTYKKDIWGTEYYKYLIELTGVDDYAVNKRKYENLQYSNKKPHAKTFNERARKVKRFETKARKVKTMTKLPLENALQSFEFIQEDVEAKKEEYCKKAIEKYDVNLKYNVLLEIDNLDKISVENVKEGKKIKEETLKRLTDINFELPARLKYDELKAIEKMLDIALKAKEFEVKMQKDRIYKAKTIVEIIAIMTGEKQVLPMKSQNAKGIDIDELNEYEEQRLKRLAELEREIAFLEIKNLDNTIDNNNK